MEGIASQAAAQRPTRAYAGTLRWQFNCMPCMAHFEKAANCCTYFLNTQPLRQPVRMQ
jgi:hypothetical protein